MQTLTATVGPLATAGATKVALSQSPPTAGNIVLNGANGSFTANNIAASQSVSGASKVLLNGITSAVIVQTGNKGAYLGSLQYIYITSAGNDTGITFTVLGLDQNGASKSEVITGSNTSVVSSFNQYWSIISITTSGSTASTITVGSYLAANMDVARQVLITTSSTTNFVITGTDWAGNPISETVINASSSVSSVLSYATVISVYSVSAPATTVSIGTSSIADSNWVKFDEYALGPTSVQATVSSAGATYTMFFSNDNPNSLFGYTAFSPASMTWVSDLSPFVGATTTNQVVLDAPFRWAKIQIESGSGTVTTKFVQWSAVSK